MDNHKHEHETSVPAWATRFIKARAELEAATARQKTACREIEEAQLSMSEAMTEGRRVQRADLEAAARQLGVEYALPVVGM